MKKILNFFIISILIIFLFSCEVNSDNNKIDDEPIDIETNIDKVEISLSNRHLVWEKVNGAEEYLIYLNSELVGKSINDYYDFDSTQSGDVYVIASKYENKHYIYSQKSNIVSLEKIISQEKSLKVFSINDTHGALKDTANDVSMAKVATYIKNLEKQEDIIKIANGDIFQGSYVSNKTYGKIFIDILNELSFDCFVIGNHEFDWGFDKIKQYKDGNMENGEANFDFLGCNIIYSDTKEHVEWLKPYYITTVNNFKVGIIGSILEKGESSIAKDKVENYEFIDAVPLIKEYAKKLRNVEHCDLVLVSTHDYDDDFNNKIANLPIESKIDGLICAHTHQYIEEYLYNVDGTKLPIIQSNTKNQSVGYIQYNYSIDNYLSSSIHHDYVNNLVEDEEIIDIFNNYNQLFLDSDVVIGYTPNTLYRSTLGHFAGDCMVENLHVDLAAVNTGGVRTQINVGEITRGQIYDAFPFDNEIYVLNIKGSVLKNYCSQQSDYLYFNNGFNINNFKDNEYYKFGLIDYVFKADYAQYYLKDVEYEKTNLYIRDVMELTLQKGLH